MSELRSDLKCFTESCRGQQPMAEKAQLLDIDVQSKELLK